MEHRHCVIVLLFDGHYISIRCDYDEGDRIDEVLSLYHNSLEAAHWLISRGDIANLCKNPVTFYTDMGYSWAQTKPVVHESPAQLVAYCLAVEATDIYEFQDDSWEEIRVAGGSELEEGEYLEAG